MLVHFRETGQPDISRYLNLPFAHTYLHHRLHIALSNEIFVYAGLTGAVSMQVRSIND
jgi:hypothetical protein